MRAGSLRGFATLAGLLYAGFARAGEGAAVPHDGLACVACHRDGPRASDRPTCSGGGCHVQESDELRRSAHDRAHLSDGRGYPGCADCHGGHKLQNPTVAACEKEFDRACLACHPAGRYLGLPGDAPRPTGLADSIHARARETAGCTSAPLTCYTCHGAHTIQPLAAPDSAVARSRITETCGRCHARERESYLQSVHARALAGGSSLAPTCTSCHGVHRILAAGAGDARTSARNVIVTCAECHEDPSVTREADLREGVVESYERTFHGVAHDNGVTDVATCTSCHGAHDVLPSADPHSRTHPARIRATCLVCHPNVDESQIARVSHPGEWRGLRATLESFTLYFPVAGTALNPLLVSGLGAIVGFLSGLFGVGGGFLMTPLLIFIGIPAAVAAATDAAQITAGASSGALSHSRLGNVDFKMGLVMVTGGWAGGYAGVRLVAVLRHLGNFDFFLKLVYVVVLGFIGAVMFIEGVRTLRGRARAGEPGPSRLSGLFARLPLQTRFPKCGLTTSALLPLSAGFLVGVLAAFLGVGGGFIMLPTMIYIIGIPTRVAVGTDLLQIVLTSSNVALQQAIINHTVDIVLAVTLFVGSALGAQLGVRASRHLKGEQIRVFLAVIVLAVMAVLLYQLLATPGHLIDFATSGGGH